MKKPADDLWPLCRPGSEKATGYYQKLTPGVNLSNTIPINHFMLANLPEPE